MKHCLIPTLFSFVNKKAIVYLIYFIFSEIKLFKIISNFYQLNKTYMNGLKLL